MNNHGIRLLQTQAKFFLLKSCRYFQSLFQCSVLKMKMEKSIPVSVRVDHLTRSHECGSICLRVSALQKMSKLYAYVKENILLGVIEMAAENRNSTLNLSNFDMKEIPALLFQLKDLTKLHLNNNSLKSLPEQISELKHLKVLAVDYNMLTSVPLSVGKLNELVCLNLSYNNLGHLIPEIGLLNNLEVLWLNHTQLESLPPEIGNCTFLDTLGARGNFLKNLPPEIGKLHRLRWLTLEGNLISKVPEEMIGLQNLIHLNLSNNQFENFPEIDELHNLQFVFLSQNFITSLDLNLMERLGFIKKIDLVDNPLSQDPAFKNYKNLKLDQNSDVDHENEGSDDSDSEDWEESAPSSDLDISESSIEGMQLDDVLEDALPQVAKFSATGL